MNSNNEINILRKRVAILEKELHRRRSINSTIKEELSRFLLNFWINFKVQLSNTIDPKIQNKPLSLSALMRLKRTLSGQPCRVINVLPARSLKLVPSFKLKRVKNQELRELTPPSMLINISTLRKTLKRQGVLFHENITKEVEISSQTLRKTLKETRNKQ